MKSNNTEAFKTIMNPTTGKMVQSGGQLGKKIIKDYKAETIYNPLTRKQVKTGGSVGKKVLGMYKAKGGSNVINSTNKVTFISYSGVITGSKNIRNQNLTDIFPVLQKMNFDNMNSIAKYAFLYDHNANKSNEPYYDAIAVQLALLDKTTFDANFMYKKVELIQQNTSESKNLVVHSNEKLSMEYLNKNKTRESMYDYDTGKHIFILGPITNSCLEKVKMCFQNNNNNRYFIHFQGETHVDNHDLETFFGLAPHTGVFENSFNYQFNMKNAKQFRKLFTNSDCYTIALKQQNSTPLPPIYNTTFKNNVLKILQKEKNQSITFENMSKLNVEYICQDVYDKDNIVSLVILLKSVQNNLKPQLELTGKNFHDIIRNGKIIDWKQYKTEGENPKFGLQFRGDKPTDATFWPAFTDSPNTTDVFSTEFTLQINDVATQNMNRFIHTAINKMLQDFEINNYTLTEECKTNVNIIQNDIPIFNEYLFVASTAYYLVATGLFPEKKKNIIKGNVLYKYKEPNFNLVNLVTHLLNIGKTKESHEIRQHVFITDPRSVTPLNTAIHKYRIQNR